MAEKTPLLSDQLTESERIALAGLVKHPGFAVLEKMFMAACARATELVIKLDPIEEGFERKLKALQTKARDRSEFSLLVLASINWQTQIVEPVKEQDNEQQKNRIVGQLVSRTE